MSECQEVAENMAHGVKHLDSMDHARRVVRNYMPDETHQVIDNVAEALYCRVMRKEHHA